MDALAPMVWAREVKFFSNPVRHLIFIIYYSLSFISCITSCTDLSGRALAGVAGSNPGGGGWGHRCLSLVGVVCSHVETSASGWQLVQIPAECGVSECDGEASTLRRPWPTGGCCTMAKIYIYFTHYEVTTVLKVCEIWDPVRFKTRFTFSVKYYEKLEERCGKKKTEFVSTFRNIKCTKILQDSVARGYASFTQHWSLTPTNLVSWIPNTHTKRTALSSRPVTNSKKRRYILRFPCPAFVLALHSFWIALAN